MNRFISLFFKQQEICPEPRTDTVPSICLTGLLAILIGGLWFSCLYTIVNTKEETEEESQELQEETPEESSSSSTTEHDTEEDM